MNSMKMNRAKLSKCGAGVPTAVHELSEAAFQRVKQGLDAIHRQKHERRKYKPVGIKKETTN